MRDNIVLQVKNVHKSFHLPTESSSGIKRAFINATKGIKGYKQQKVLRDISLTVERGDFVGIVGRNGSGKSTLLKLISGIYQPDSGSIYVNGSMVSFIELGVGFDPELTGRENVYLNGALLGFSNKEIDRVYDNIVEFAELHEFMDQKLKNYSSGMQVRLAFAVAIQAEGDILVLDEVLAVGDEAFQRKCNDFFEIIKHDKKKTVILVTHGMDNVRKYCNKAILIKDGAVEMQGSPDDVANQYSLENIKSESSRSKDDNIFIAPVSDQILKSGDLLEFDVVYNTNDIEKKYVGISIWSADAPLFSDDTKKFPTNTLGEHRFRYSYELKNIGTSDLKITASLYDHETNELVSYAKEGASSHFKVIGSVYGLLADKGRWI